MRVGVQQARVLRERRPHGLAREVDGRRMQNALRAEAPAVPARCAEALGDARVQALPASASYTPVRVSYRSAVKFERVWAAEEILDDDE